MHYTDLQLMREDAPQGAYALRKVVNGPQKVPGWIVRAGALWRIMPQDLLPWCTVYQPLQRWIAASTFAAMVHHLRVLCRLEAGHAAALR